ncbi:MAG TPA: type I polyketide synthase, partial [Thermoanaerobaculia bacterium]|nr:type I polyketide synthase [Thermoanaerobaculia bacterium]
MSAAEVPGTSGLEIAVVGMSCRFPGAESVAGFWRNLCDGVESLIVLSDEQMASVPAAQRRSPSYVRIARTIPDVDKFDAAFFGVNPREADVMDPQHRIFLEGCWAALEDSGYDPERYPGSVGVYAGSRLNFYLMNAYSNQALVSAVGDLMTQIANEKDYLANRVSYKLNLGGPSVVVQSACSTALVAVHMACQGLLAGECDMALAGGVAVRVPEVGYPYRPGDINSPDGRVRAFDAQAQGTIFGTGLGVVVLKRLADALADGDTIHAVIKGSAVSNDGSQKVGFTAPGVDGQYRVIQAALTAAEVSPETIAYVEAHGTGTPVGDPIEVTALTKVFRESTEARQFCALGSVKSNIGHLGAAAGIASLIKTVLALKHRQIPPSINFERPNPQIDFAASPFFVNTELREWAANGTPRRAGVSAFGMGGTNAHAVLEEAPELAPTSPSRPWQLLLLSARTETALATQAENLAAFLEAHSETGLADAAYTLQVGRKLHEHRRAVVCRGVEHARQVLAGQDPDWSAAVFSPGRERPVVFLFSGQGAQYAGMGRGLYETEPTFRAQVDACCERLTPHLGLDLRELLLAPDGDAEAAGRLAETRFTQPALFVIEHALARLWMEWGIRPEAMLGHSIGEYVAACLAGVFSLDDALVLVAERGRLMQSLPSGAMLAVPLPEAEVLPLLGEGLSLAAVNAPDRCVVSGPHAEVDALRASLEAKGVAARPLHTSHAFHSMMMEPILAPFVERFAGVALHAPRIPYISNVTGTWITPAEATDPAYWARHLRQAVRFADGVRELCQDARRVFLEVGPGQTLATLARQHPDCGSRHPVLSSLRHPKERKEDLPVLLKALGQLWTNGVPPDWSGFYLRERRRRIPLPTYPFERQRHWVERDTTAGLFGVEPEVQKKPDVADWFYLPYWKPSVTPTPTPEEVERAGRWLVFLDDSAWGEAVTARLAGEGRRVAVVRAAEGFRRTGEGRWEIAPGRREDYDALIKDLAAAGALPDCVLHLWSLGPMVTDRQELARVPERSFWSLLYLAQALGKQGVTQRIHLGIVSSAVQAVAGEERLVPERALLLGPLKSMAQEYPSLRCVGIDVPWPPAPSLAGKLIAETTVEPARPVAAYRGNSRWVQDYEAVRLEAPAPGALPLRERGVYLITGGLGGLGLTFAEMLAREHRARLVLLGVSALPDRGSWDEWLAAHGETDRISQRLRKIREIEALGSEVMVAGADVTDREQMRALVAQATARFGAIHGVIHAAGLAGGGMIQLKTTENARRVLAPKVEGTRTLLDALAGEPLDFVVFCSSTIAVAGGLGQVDYCAANNFLDGLAHDLALAGGPRTVSINWGAWEEVGMAVAAGLTRGASAAMPEQAAPSEDIHPLLDRCVFEMADQTIYETSLSTGRHWVVREHQVVGVPTLPGTTYL